MPKLDLKAIDARVGNGYPHPHNLPCDHRINYALGDAGGLDQFGVNLVTLPAAKSGEESWASQRHWHSAEDEFVYILSGNCTLVDDTGETPLSTGDACTHKANDGNGHHLVNTSGSDVTFLVVGARRPENDHCRYADIDLDLPATGQSDRDYFHKDGTPY
ncbi:MAG: transcriptional regulator [Robiginitomaculum sp.]|nr:MAG: transcriptional regulator [Robiginitomaculum sp.]